MINYWALASIIIFYLLILCVGFWASRRQKANKALTESENVILAGRDINLFIGIFTMTATWVGGGYINGTAEIIYTPGFGLLWCQAPVGYSISLFFGGMFFAKKMRENQYVTMLDPFEKKYGKVMGALLFLPALMGEICWSAAILAALGSTLAVVIDIPITYSIIISALIALLYTMFGGLYAVVYTDVLQLVCIFFGMWLCVPFALTNENLSPWSEDTDKYIGSIDPRDSGNYIDSLLLLIMGGIPWQVYFQRVLSSRSPGRAKQLSIAASIGCFLMAIPPALIGIAAAKADWKAVGYEGIDENGVIKSENLRLVLPLVLQYLCPTWVSVIGLGAVSAAVMSSADSSVLSSSSMFVRNVIRPLFWRNASEKKVIWMMRFMMIFVASIACIMGIFIPTIYGLFYLCSDFVYVILFPQLVSVLYIDFTNTYGSSSGYVVGLLFRLLTGDSIATLPTAIKFPDFQDDGEGYYYQRWPTKTLSMLSSFITLVSVSYLFKWLHKKGYLTEKYDVFRCFHEDPDVKEINGLPDSQSTINDASDN